VSEILDLELNILVTEVNTIMFRFNHAVQRHQRAHDDMQRTFLDRKLPDQVWERYCEASIANWVDLVRYLDELDGKIREVKARAVLLVRQYDSPGDRRRRSNGLGKWRPIALDKKSVAAELAAYKVDRAKELDQSQKDAEYRWRDVRMGETPPAPGPSSGEHRG
jgi:hypothetical protein